MAIRIKVENQNQAQELTINNEKIIINGVKPRNPIGYTDIDFQTWLEIKRAYPLFISKRVFYVNQGDEKQAFITYRANCFQEFESIGVPSVKASVALNEFFPKDKLLLAHEWLESKSMMTTKPVPSTSSKFLQRFAEPLLLGVLASILAAALWYFYGP